jgi:hypothetical protein
MTESWSWESEQRWKWLARCYSPAGSSRPSNVIANALSAGFHRFIQRRRPVPVGSSDLTARYRHFNAACSLGKCPRARVARLVRACRLSMVIFSSRVGQGCDLRRPVVDSVVDGPAERRRHSTAQERESALLEAGGQSLR